LTFQLVENRSGRWRFAYRPYGWLYGANPETDVGSISKAPSNIDASKVNLAGFVADGALLIGPTVGYTAQIRELT